MVAEMPDLHYDWQHVDIQSNATKTEDFLSLNPNGKIPVIQFNDGRLMCESNAIIHYLANGSPLVPNDPFLHAKMLQWQFFEQYSHEPQLAVARYIKRYLGLPIEQIERHSACIVGNHRVLNIMEQHLQDRIYFLGNKVTLADVSLFAYTHVAPQGGVELEPYPAIQAWIKRISRLPGGISIPAGVSLIGWLSNTTHRIGHP